MIKTKYVVGDVVVIDGKQLVVVYVEAWSDVLYVHQAIYKLSNGIWCNEEDLV